MSSTFILVFLRPISLEQNHSLHKLASPTKGCQLLKTKQEFQLIKFLTCSFKPHPRTSQALTPYLPTSQAITLHTLVVANLSVVQLVKTRAVQTSNPLH